MGDGESPGVRCRGIETVWRSGLGLFLQSSGIQEGQEAGFPYRRRPPERHRRQLWMDRREIARQPLSPDLAVGRGRAEPQAWAVADGTRLALPLRSLGRQVRRASNLRQG